MDILPLTRQSSSRGLWTWSRRSSGYQICLRFCEPQALKCWCQCSSHIQPVRVLVDLFWLFMRREHILLNCRQFLYYQVSKRMSDLLLCMSTTCSWFTLLLPHIQCFTMSFWEWKQSDNQYFDQFAQFFLTCFYIYTRTRTPAMMIKIIHSFIITRWRCLHLTAPVVLNLPSESPLLYRNLQKIA